MRCLLSLLASAVLVSACGTSPPPECDLCGEPASSRLRAIEGTTWLVSRVVFSEETDGVAPGLDLDGIDSAEGSTEIDSTCEEFNPDWASPLDPELTGVDNAGQSLISTGEALVAGGFRFQDELDRAMREGRIRWALRVGAVDPEDPWRIELELFAVTDPLAIGTDGRPVPDQTLAARRVARADGVVRGSVAIAFAETTELDVDGEVTLMPFDDLVVGGWAIGATSVEGAIAVNLAASFSVDRLVEVTERDVGFSPGDEDIARSVYEAVADLEPSDADPTACERVSMGFGLEAVPVELVVE